MSVRMHRSAAALTALISTLCLSGITPLHAQQLPVLPPLEEEPLVQPPQVEAPPYPVEQLQPMAPVEPRPVMRPPAPPPDEPVFSGGGVAIQGGLGSSQQILLSFNASAALFGLGLGFGYNQAGVIPNVGGTDASTETIAFQLAAYVAYMAYNTKPLAFGPELDFEAQLAPGTPFEVSTLVPGFAVWYAPFPSAPLLLGTMLGLRIGFTGYGNPTVSTDYPGVRLRWGF